MILYGALRDIAGVDTDGMVSILSRVTRESTVTPGDLITREIHREPVEDGHFRIEGLDPGPVTIEVTAGNEYSRWDINLPDGDGEHNITDLVMVQVEWEPEVVGKAQRAQRAAEAAATRAEAGADRVGTAEAVLGARDQAVAAASTATGAATTATTEADRAGSRATAADGSATQAGTSETNAKTSETNAHADAVATAADRAQTGADRVVTGADRTATTTARDAATQAVTDATGQADRATTGANRAEAEATRAKTEADRASAAADLADGAAVQAVTERVDTLLAGAPAAYDTLLEIATKLSGQDDVAAAMTAQIGQKAETSVVAALSTKVDGILVALDGKAPTVHSHTMAQVTGLDAALGAKLDASKIQTVSMMPATPVAGTFYFVTGGA